jgi:hypothetical protein
MDGFKNTTKTSYDTLSGRKFANGGMTVSRNDMAGGQGPMNKPAMVAKYAKGGPVKKAMGGMTTAAPATSSSKIITPEDKAKYAAEINSSYRETKPLGPRAQAQNARMGPVKRAKGGSVKMREGGVFNEKGKRATLAEIAAEGRRVEGRKPPVEGISTRPTDDSGRRMTDKELGMAPGGVDTAKKKPMPKVMSDLERARMMARPLPRKAGGGVPAHSDRPMIRRKTGGLAVMPGKKC